MRANTLLALVSAITLASAIPNPYPEPTAAVGQRDAEPMYCVKDARGERCMPGKLRRAAAPEPTFEARADVEARRDLESRGWYTSKDSLCTIEHHQTRCVPNDPTCTTFKGKDGVKTTQCVLKRDAKPEPTTFVRKAREAKPAMCITDAHGVRCLAGKRNAAPEPTAAPEPIPAKLEARDWYSSDGALCTVDNYGTRCIPNVVRCTTNVIQVKNATETQVACVL